MSQELLELKLYLFLPPQMLPDLLGVCSVLCLHSFVALHIAGHHCVALLYVLTKCWMHPLSVPHSRTNLDIKLATLNYSKNQLPCLCFWFSCQVTNLCCFVCCLWPDFESDPDRQLCFTDQKTSSTSSTSSSTVLEVWFWTLVLWLRMR